MSTRRQNRSKKVLRATIVLLLGCAFAFLPVAWALSTSFKGVGEATAYPPSWIPHNPTLENYKSVIFSQRYLHYLGNTLFIAGVSVGFSLIIAVHAAYAVARGSFAGKNAMMFILWTTIMMPGAAILVPLYLVTVNVGLYDTHAGLILIYSAAIIPTLVWLLRGFIQRIPRELEQAAMVDGCGRWGAFYRVVLPLARPGLMAGGLLGFVTVWNEFLIAFALTRRDEVRTIQVGIYYFVTDVGIEWGRMTAAVIASVIPIILLYTLLQRRFIQGMTGGAVQE